MIKVLEKRPGSAAYFSRLPEGYNGLLVIDLKILGSSFYCEDVPDADIDYITAGGYEFIAFYSKAKGTPLNNTGIVIIAEGNDNHIGSISLTLEEMRGLFPQLFKE